MARDFYDIREFVIIEEEDDPQRSFLLENYSGTFEILMFGDSYHERISTKIEGFLDGVAYADISFTIRKFRCESFGEDYDVTISKNLIGEFEDMFEIETQDGDIIPLTLVETIEAN